uniref:Uncharacterized protein n=1 Tax=Myotis myotis TaxID=51298 RepID=A0A7J7Y001_MYOMY|nr:hypothetical protein mMyoMyo1_011398 [Myotis myotis]
MLKYYKVNYRYLNNALYFLSKMPINSIASHEHMKILIDFFFLIYFIDFLQRGRERDRELETSMREKHRSAASCTSPTGDMPTTQVHALDRNRTWDPSVRRLTLYPLSQTGFGKKILIDLSGFLDPFLL